MRDHRMQFNTSSIGGLSGQPGWPRAASAAVQALDWRFALECVLEESLTGVEQPPDLVVLFASSSWSADFDDLLREAHSRSRASCLIGSSSHGAISNGASVESEPSMAMLALWLPGAKLTPVRLHQSMLDVLEDSELWHEMYGLLPEETHGWIMFADPYRMDAQETVCRLRGLYPDTPIVGALASTTEADRRTWVFLDDHV